MNIDKKEEPKVKKTNQKTNYKKCIVLISALLLIIVILILLKCCHYHSRYCNCTDTIDNDISLPVDDELIDGELTPEQQELIEPSYFNIRINPTPELINGKMNLRLENPSHNIYSCQVEIVLTENEKVIYKSARIDPNKTLEYCTVSESLPKGTHQATVKYMFYETGTENNTGQCNVKIDIKST